MNATAWTDTVVSITKSARDTRTQSAMVGEVLFGIMGGHWAAPVAAVRAAATAGDEEAKRNRKAALPGVMFSGTFSKRGNACLLEHSGLLCLDFDKLGDRLADARAIIQADPHCAAAFVSPSGDGLKVLVLIPADGTTHKAAFEVASAHYAALGFEADPARKDVAGMCFVSHDPDLFCREDAKPIELPARQPSEPEVDGPEDHELPPPARPEVEAALSRISADCSYGFWLEIGMALHSWDAAGGLALWDKWSKTAPKRYQSGACARHWGTFKAGAGVSIGTLFHRAGTSPETWGPLLPFEGTEYGPPLPLEILPPVLRDFVATVAASKQVPVELPALLAIGAFAAAGAKRFEVCVGETHREPLNIYGLALLDPGERKSGTFADVLRPLEEAEAALIEAAGPRIKRAMEVRALDEARLAELRKRAAKSNDPALRKEAVELSQNMAEIPPAPRLLCGDVTSEGLAVMLAQHGGRMLQADAEGGTFFNIIGGAYSKNGAASLDVHLKAHAGDAIRVDRATRGASCVTQPALTLLLTGQPDLLRRIKGVEEMRARGLLARFAYVLPPPMVGRRTYDNVPIYESAAAAFSRAVKVVLSMADAGEPRPLTIEGEAWEVWREFAQRTEGELAEGGPLAEMRDWGAKLPGLVARLSGILHLADGGGTGPIASATVAAACIAGEVFTAHAKATFALMAGAKDEMARRLLEWIRRNRLERFTIGEAYESLRHGMGDGACRDDLLRPLDIMESRRYIRREASQPTRKTRGGRPESTAYEVNPAAYEVTA